MRSCAENNSPNAWLYKSTLPCSTLTKVTLSFSTIGTASDCKNKPAVSSTTAKGRTIYQRFSKKFLLVECPIQRFLNLLRHNFAIRHALQTATNDMTKVNEKGMPDIYFIKISDLFISCKGGVDSGIRFQTLMFEIGQ